MATSCRITPFTRSLPPTQVGVPARIVSARQASANIRATIEHRITNGLRLVGCAAGADTPNPTNHTVTATNNNGEAPSKATTPGINGTSAPRGGLIVVEGLDRSGKSTQLAKLVEALEQSGIPVAQSRVPNRASPKTGAVIQDYLSSKKDMPDEAIHLLFSFNRWEQRDGWLAALAAGTTVIIDRYAYSGVAYSAAKQVPGMDPEWCKVTDEGLPAPDLTLYFKVDEATAAARGGYGQERYEKKDFQRKVGEEFLRLQDATWVVLDASLGVEELHEQVMAQVLPVLQQCAAGERPLRRLWDLEPLV